MGFIKLLIKTSIIVLFILSIVDSLAVTEEIKSNVLVSSGKLKSASSINNNKSTPLATISGMLNHYDDSLGKTTFEWALEQGAKADIGAIATKHQNEVAADFYLKRLTGANKVNGSLAKPIVAFTHDIGRGAKIVKYKEEFAGVEVFNSEYNIMMDREFDLVASSGYLLGKKAKNSDLSIIKNLDAAFGDSQQAILIVYSKMGGNINEVTLVPDKNKSQYEKYKVINTAKTKILLGEPRAKKVFFEHKNTLVPAFYVEIEVGEIDTNNSDYFAYVVSVETETVFYKKNLKNHATDFNYRVYANQNGQPWDSPHGNVVPAPVNSDPQAYSTANYFNAPLVTLSHGAISTMDPWLEDNAQTTSGNNVNAYIDAIAPQGFSNGDFRAEVTSTNTFDYVYDESQADNSTNNRKAAIVNLFFVNNFLHDDFYDHGFDEASGNAQNQNYNRGGLEGDALNVEVQDYSGFDNANMSTPADGFSPRMQMFLWNTDTIKNGLDYGVTVTSHSDIGLLNNVQFASFGAETFDLSGRLVRIEDISEPIRDGCDELVNSEQLTGNIAIVDRGDCNFTVKVKLAQDAGAIAVLVANNRDGNQPSPMGGTDDTVTIPSMGLSENEGAVIYTLMDQGEAVFVDIFRNDFARILKGSSWDNAVIAHEWGHYISNRLVGNSAGLSSHQAGSMGEGFGDFHALLFVSDTEDNLILGNENYNGSYSNTTYVASFVEGIRQYPYSTDMTVNPLTFADVESDPEIHSSGAVYASMLWDSFIALVNSERYTFAQAKSLMKDYLVTSYKMMPMAPTFTEGRDALLAAAFANNPEDYKTILSAFARRGMGLGAVSPSRFATDHSGVVESFKTELDTFTVLEHALNTNYEGLNSGYCSNDNILDKGETGTISFTIKNVGSSALVGLSGIVTSESGHDVSFANDGVITFGDIAIFESTTSNPLEFTLNEANTGDELILKFTPDMTSGLEASDYLLSTTINIDFVMRDLEGTSQTNNLNSLARLNDFSETVITGDDFAKNTWGLDQFDVNDGMIAAKANTFISDVVYQTRTISVGFNGDFTIGFWHLYNLEEGFDGAIVEVRINNGEWTDVLEAGGEFLGDGYNDIGLEETEAYIQGQEMFSGTNFGIETINFGESLNGEQVELRFRLATDSGFVTEPFTGFDSGWYIDDITLTNIENSIFSDVVPGDTFACDNRLPAVSVADNISTQIVNEGDTVFLSVQASDPNNDVLNYQWTETSNQGVTILEGNSANASFIAPEVTSGSIIINLTLTVNDGTDSVVKTVSITVNNVIEPVVTAPTTASTQSSGGAINEVIFLLLLTLTYGRKQWVNKDKKYS